MYGFSYWTYLGCFLLGATVTLLVTPWTIGLARRLGAIDQPDKRKIHQEPTPRLGGLAVFVGMWTPLLLLCFWNNRITQELAGQWPHFIALFTAGLAMLALGLVDDLRGLNARWKFGAEFPVAILLVLLGHSFGSLTVPGYGSLSLGPFGPLVTVLWIVGITNALNLVDGIDGLATGVAFFAAATHVVLAVLNANYLLALPMCALAGASLGFLRYNFSPARVFLGDCGALSIGMTLALTAVAANTKGTLTASLFIPLLVLGYPVVDTLLAMGRRRARGKPLFAADRGHIHHRLLARGLSHSQVALVLYGLCALFCFTALAAVMRNNLLVAIGLLVLMVFFMLGARFLGAARGFSIRTMRAEDRQFLITYHFGELMRAKLGLAESPAEVLRLLVRTAEEFEVHLFEVHLPATRVCGELAERWPAQAQAAAPAEPALEAPALGSLTSDHVFFKETGLRLRVDFAKDRIPDELLVEQRMLWSDLARLANNRLLAWTLPPPAVESAPPAHAPETGKAAGEAV